MSLCQPKTGNVSCGSCCGLFNLDLKPGEYKKLLQERTEEFSEQVDFQTKHTIPAFRQSREKKESSIPKKDDTTYNCPYLGYLDASHSRIGCMIHPIRTGDPLSQNFSFYGASICQGYECKNKERPLAEFWEELFAEIAEDSHEYSQFSANHPWVRKWERALGIPDSIPDTEDPRVWRNKYHSILEKNSEIIKKDLLALQDEIQKGNLNLTAFEIDYNE